MSIFTVVPISGADGEIDNLRRTIKARTELKKREKQGELMKSRGHLKRYRPFFDGDDFQTKSPNYHKSSSGEGMNNSNSLRD